jgi:hypothetical protein
MESGFEEDLYEIRSSGGAPHKKNDTLDEINLLLMDDKEAHKMVLEILRSRKSINDTTAKLKDKKPKSMH